MKNAASVLVSLFSAKRQTCAMQNRSRRMASPLLLMGFPMLSDRKRPETDCRSWALMVHKGRPAQWESAQGYAAVPISALGNAVACISTPSYEKAIFSWQCRGDLRYLALRLEFSLFLSLPRSRGAKSGENRAKLGCFGVAFRASKEMAPRVGTKVNVHGRVGPCRESTEKR